MNLRRLLRVSNWRLAVGEFALIFVGILAALGADDWNTRRVERAEELATLQGIRSALASDAEELDSMAVFLEEKERRVLALQNHLTARLPYSDSLDSFFGAVYGFKESYLNRAPYEALRSRGFDLISNDSLQVQIIRLYDEQYRFVEQVDERHRSTMLDLFRPYFLQHFVNPDFNISATPLDYSALLRDQYFLNLIGYRAALLRIDTRPAYDTAVVRSSELLNLIDAELGNRRD